MPAVVKKLFVCAAVDGLLLWPHLHRQQKPVQPLQINYSTKEITVATAQDFKGLVSLEAHGIAGLFTVASCSYLIAISSRQQVAQIRGKPVYVVTGVALIPLSSQIDAVRAIELSKTATAVAEAKGADTDRDTTDEEEQGYQSTAEDNDENTGLSSTDEREPPSKHQVASADDSVAQDVIRRKGQYGRFAERWFSRKGWTADKRRSQGMSIDKNTERPRTAPEANITEYPKSSISDTRREQQRTSASLLPKLLRTTKILFGSRNFYFSYDLDITRRLGTSQKSSNELPLYKLVDPLFFWNRSLFSSFINAGHHSYVLPLMQGFIGQKVFTVETGNNDSQPAILDTLEDPQEVIELQDRAMDGNVQPKLQSKAFLITLISRRSVLRPGLRYLRRGIDEEGHVANAVETEQILSDPSWAPSSTTHSFTQIRGSIPLFFSQSPYSFKPVVVLQHSPEANHAAFKRHFSNMSERYGRIQIAMLVDKHGNEAKIGEAFDDHTKLFNRNTKIDSDKLGFEWFDFHRICAGMKFENVNILMETLKPVLSSFGMSREVNGRMDSIQSGILRTNCMDCLDRTNVVQSATAQRALEAQLAMEGIEMDLQVDSATQWFNSLWADNGDAVSKQYSSTAALKGDYTRTRRRDYRGALNDFGLTLSRYYNNIVNDYFSQTAMDFLLGNVTDEVFEEFESNMKSADPGVSMKRVRQNAIDTSAKIVIEGDSEELLGGWTLATPYQSNTLRTLPLEEIVFLLTDAALYAVRFDWNTEKVSSFERIDLRSVVKVQQGVYITSTLTSAQTDEQRNVGIIISYKPGRHTLERVNTRSMSTVKIPQVKDFDQSRNRDEKYAEYPISPQGDGNIDQGHISKSKGVEELRILALKALSSKSSVSSGNKDFGEILTEKQVVNDVCRHIEQAMGEEDNWVKQGDIIGLIEAKRSTGFLEQWQHSLKKFVWAS